MSWSLSLDHVRAAYFQLLVAGCWLLVAGQGLQGSSQFQEQKQGLELGRGNRRTRSSQTPLSGFFIISQDSGARPALFFFPFLPVLCLRLKTPALHRHDEQSPDEAWRALLVSVDVEAAPHKATAQRHTGTATQRRQTTFTSLAGSTRQPSTISPKLSLRRLLNAIRCSPQSSWIRAHVPSTLLNAPKAPVARYQTQQPSTRVNTAPPSHRSLPT